MTGPDDAQPPADATPPDEPPPADSGEAAKQAASTKPAAGAEQGAGGEPAASAEQTASAEPSASGEQAVGADDGARSGLRNPAAAVRGVGAGALVIEALVLLLAIVPLTKLDTRATGWAIGAVVVLCVLCIALAGLLRYRWAWYAGIVVQLLVCLCGFFHLMLLVFGIIFGAVWAYVLSVRHSVLGEV